MNLWRASRPPAARVPEMRAGFYAPAPMDFLLYLFRLVIWGLIWRLRDELE